MKLIKKFLGVISILSYLVVSPAAAMAATLTLNPASGTFNKSCEVTVRIDLDTQSVQTDGTDVILIYNPSQLSSSTSQITNGTVYPDYPGNSVDNTAGKISISGISSVSSPFTGTGTFATVKFNVANTLTANTPVTIKFDFDPNNKTKTTDTNIVERGTIADVLSSVTDGSFTAGTGQCSGSASPSGTGTGTGTGTGVSAGQGQTLPGSGVYATPSAQYQVLKPKVIDDITGNGKSSGLLDNTIIVSSAGVLLVILGVIGLAFL